MLSSRTMPVIVGLTGSIGMGKSTASAWCRRAGIPVHDADACVHALYGPGGAAVSPVASAFPGVVAGEGGGIDRTALSAAVAAAGRDAALKTLEGIVHPLVTADREAFIARAAAEGAWCVVLDIPLLLETMNAEARAKLLDALVVVSAPTDIQRARVLARPGMSEEKLSFILSKQVADADKRAAADNVIETGHASFAPARALLAACFQALATKHDGVHSRWAARATTQVGPAGSSSGIDAGMPLPPRSVTLDLDDTCWPTLPPIMAASERLAADMAEFLPNSAAACQPSTLNHLKAAVSAAVDKEPLLAHDMTESRRAGLASLATAHGDDPTEAVDECMRRFLVARSDVGDHLYADTAPSIRALRDAGLRVGALTNGNCDVRLSGPAVSSLFDFAIGAVDAGAAKPDAAPFWFAAAAAECSPAEMVHVGDDVHSDLIGALRAGSRAILLSRPEQQPRKPRELEALGAVERDATRWREVATLQEAVEVIGEWAAAAAAGASAAR